ncbi:MAG: hypothetical protein ABSF29_16720 [Tepidisphaeraceae bacterium]
MTYQSPKNLQFPGNFGSFRELPLATPQKTTFPIPEIGKNRESIPDSTPNHSRLSGPPNRNTFDLALNVMSEFLDHPDPEMRFRAAQFILNLASRRRHLTPAASTIPFASKGPARP